MTAPRAIAALRRMTPAILGAALAAGCAGRELALDPAGPQAGRIVGLWTLYAGACAAVYVIVVGLVIGARWRKARARRLPPIKSPPEPQETRLRRAVLGGVAATVLVLLVLMAAEFATARSLHTLAGPEEGRADLTHVGSRSLIAGILPNARGHLAGWVVDPQRIEPGVRMPMSLVGPDEVEPLLPYLDSLK